MDNKILKEILTERKRQDEKWGEQNHFPTYWMVILMEEVGEAARDLCGKFQNYPNYRKELIHIAAVAISAAESYDRYVGELDSIKPIPPEELECPSCGALNKSSKEREEFSIIDCHNCNAVLEFVGNCLSEVADDI